jgi:hypothetical protein
LKPLFTQLARAIGSSHFQVAERALFLWHNEYISGLIADHRHEVLPIIYPVLHENAEQHWNVTVKNLTHNVLKIFVELDEEHNTRIVESCSKVYAERKRKKEIRQKMHYDMLRREQAEREAIEAKERAMKPESVDPYGPGGFVASSGEMFGDGVEDDGGGESAPSEGGAGGAVYASSGALDGDAPGAPGAPSSLAPPSAAEGAAADPSPASGAVSGGASAGVSASGAPVDVASASSS